MWRAWSGWMAVCSLIVSGAIAAAQDSGPGPVEGSVSQQYEVTVLKFGSVQTGTFDFAVEGEEPGTEEPATGEPGTTNPVAFTTGTFASSINTSAGTGTWYAIDLGNYSLFVATAEGTTGSQVVTGYATPEFIAGRIVTQSNIGAGRGRFLRALFNTSIFVGTAVEAEPEEPEEPMMEDPMTEDPMGMSN